MFKYIRYILFFVFFVFFVTVVFYAGFLCCQWGLYSLKDKNPSGDSPAYSALVSLLALGPQVLSPEETGCQDILQSNGEVTVAGVVASLVEMNSSRDVNGLSYGCFENSCSLAYDGCPPWRESECSSRFLRFDLSDSGEIEISSISCFNVP